MNPTAQGQAKFHPAKLFEGSVLLLAANADMAGSSRIMLENRGYHVLQAAGADQALALLKRRTDIVLVVACGHASLDGDILAVRAFRDSAIPAPWMEYVILSAHASAVPGLAVSDQEADSIVSARDSEQALSAIAEAFNLARLQRHQANELSELERAVQEFRTRTEAAMSQLLARARGAGPSATAAELVLEAEEPESAGGDMARVMEEERARARVREKYFGAFRLGHAGWMLLLVLAEVQGAGNELTVKSAAYAAGVPLSSALRKIGELCEDGLLLRRPDPTDNRRSFVMLTERAKTLLREYMAAVRRAGRT
jgi:DNA-binding MarR family transcriptional regulator/DNA-binding response OmpR family regulator